MTKSRYISLVLILGSLTALAPFSIDMYLPAFPAIGDDLATSAAKVSLSLSGFFIGISAGQLLYGPLLDRFGRKKPLYTGLCIYILASVGCIFSHSITSLIVLRFIQALGSCAATVVSVTMVRDLFPANENAKVFALLMLVLGASPLIAPTIGGYISTAFGWHAVFLVLMILCILIFAACLRWLPDGMAPDLSLSLKPAPIVRSFLTVFRNPTFYTYCFTGATAFMGLFAYVGGSPVVFMNVYGVSQRNYGWIFAFLSVGFIGSSQVNNLLLKKYSSQQIIKTTLPCYAALSLVFLFVSQTNWMTLPVIIFFLFLLLSCVGIANPNIASLTLAPFSKNAGTASSLMGAIQMGMGALISVFISLFDKPSVTPLALSMLVSAVLSWLAFRLGTRKIRPHDETVISVV